MRFRPVFAGAFLSSIAVLAAGIAACSSSSDNGATPTAEAGADTSIGPVGSNESKQKGTIMDAIDKFPVVGATVTIEGKTAVTGADATKGLLVVRVYPKAPCDSEQGSLLSIEPAGTSKVTYFASGKPSTAATSTTKDEAFSAVFSDVDVGVPIKVTVNSPLCEQIAFPIDDAGITDTGVQKTEAGDVLSYIRTYIGPKKAVDASTD